jgi:hypothetical protein
MNQQPEQLSTTHYIFKEVFHVRIQYLQMRTIEDLEFFGMPRCDYSPYDKQASNELRDIMIPISKMVEYFQGGVQLYFPNINDIVTIYQHITNHLNAWKEEIRRSMHIGSAPIEDLQLLDQFANSVYDHAKFQFTDEIVSSLTATSARVKKISSITSILRPLDQLNKKKEVQTGPNVRVIGDYKQYADPVPEVEEKKYPEREGLGSFLQEAGRNTGLGSLNGPQVNAQTPAPTRSKIVDKDGLSYQSLMLKGKSWRS